MPRSVPQNIQLRSAIRRDRIIRGRSAVVDAQRLDWRKFINRSQSEAQDTVAYLDGIPARRATRAAGAILRTIVIKNSSAAAGTHVAVSPALVPPVRVVDVAVMLQSAVLTESGMFWQLFLSPEGGQLAAGPGDAHLFDMVHQVNGAPQAGELAGELASWPHDSGGAPLRINRVFDPGLRYIKHVIRNVAAVTAAFYIELTVVENAQGDYEDELLPVGGIARSRVSAAARPQLANLSPQVNDSFMRQSPAVQRVTNLPRFVGPFPLTSAETAELERLLAQQAAGVTPLTSQEQSDLQMILNKQRTGRGPTFGFAFPKGDDKGINWYRKDLRMPSRIAGVNIAEGQDSLLYTVYGALPDEPWVEYNEAEGDWFYHDISGALMPEVELTLAGAMPQTPAI